MKVNTPTSMEQYEPQIEFFFSLMLMKLHTNRHKGFGGNTPLREILARLREEIIELEQELDNGDQFSAAVEAADIANFALLLAMRGLDMTRTEFDEQKGTL